MTRDRGAACDSAQRSLSARARPVTSRSRPVSTSYTNPRIMSFLGMKGLALMPRPTGQGTLRRLGLDRAARRRRPADGTRTPPGRPQAGGTDRRALRQERRVQPPLVEPRRAREDFRAETAPPPLAGEIEIAYEALEPVGDPDQTLYIYTVEPGSKSEQALQLLGSWIAGERTAPATEDSNR
jgi:hypothetical protein